MSLGTIAFDEVILPIISITLERGLILVTAVAEPVTATVDNNADFTIFAPDGTVVAHVAGVLGVPDPRRARGGRLTVILPFRLAGFDRQRV